MRLARIASGAALWSLLAACGRTDAGTRAADAAVPTLPPAHEPGLPMIAAGGMQSCFLGRDGFAVCWGHDSGDKIWPPNERFVGMYAGGFGTYGLRADGSLVLWGGGPIGTACFPDSKRRYALVADSGSIACGIQRETERAYCWADGCKPPDAPLRAIAVGGGACGVTLGGELVCWGTISEKARPKGPLLDVAFGGGTICGLRPNGDVDCDDGQARPAGVSRLVGGRFGFCAIKADASLECWGADMKAAPAGRFHDVSVGSRHACAIRTDEKVVCWGYGPDGETEPPSHLAAPAAPAEHSP